VGFRQLRWVGGIGVYFGGRPGPEPDVFHFQLIDLRQAEGNSRQFTLTRSTGKIWLSPDGERLVSTHAFASSRLPPLDASEQLLELEVKPRGLVMVRLNGVCHPALVADTAAAVAALKGSKDRGEFGIYCVGSTGTISTARFLPAE
jgi:hypothetical protein